jgi:polyhydroxyalkanoate synthesis regulator phasin
MSDLFTRALLSGLGIASLTKDAMRKAAQDLVDRSKLSEEEGRRLAKDLQRRSTVAQKAIETQIETSVRKVLKRFNLEIVKNVPKGSKVIPKKTAPRSRRSARASKAPSR